MEPDLIVELVKNDILFWGLNASNIASIASLLGVIVSFCTIIFTLTKYSTEKRTEQKIKAQEKLLQLRREIDNKIEKFFGPINELREESKILYNLFAIELKENKRREGKYFRTIEFFCSSSDKFSVTDEALIKEIMGISVKTVTLIENNIGIIANPALSSLLGKACAHFRILELGYKGLLKNQWGKFKNMDIAFPLELDGALTNEARKLEEYYNNKKSEMLNFANKPKSINPTIKYYNHNANSYYSDTMFVDMSKVYKNFREYIKIGASILDVGCGVGRDTKYFIQHGYKVYSVDASEEMVKMCNKYPFAFCKKMDMTELVFFDEFDAIWANASLLHLNKIDFDKTLQKLINATKVNGFIFFSLKEFDNRQIFDERHYEFYKQNDILRKLGSIKEIEPIKYWTDDKCFNNFIIKKIF